MRSRKYRIKSGRVENLFQDRTGFPEVFRNSSLSRKLGFSRISGISRKSEFFRLSGFSRILKLYGLKYGATIITIYFIIKHYNFLYNLIIRKCRNSWETRKLIIKLRNSFETRPDKTRLDFFPTFSGSHAPL